MLGFGRIAPQRRLQFRFLPGCRRAGPAIEFAIASPMLIMMVLGTFDISQAIITIRGLSVSSQQVVAAATTFAANQTTPGMLTPAQGAQAISIGTGQFQSWTYPNYTQPWQVVLSSISITVSPSNCTSSCTYTASTAWSETFAEGMPQTIRPCGALTQVPDSSPSSLSTLPVDVVSTPAIMVADVATVFTPIFFNFITGPVTLMRSAYLPPRIPGSAAYTRMNTATPLPGTICSGY